MKPDLLQILCCPTCRAELSLTARQQRDGEVWEGELVCSKCGTVYPIQDGIPNLLPPDERD